ncbi:MAG: tyrosine-type recombinase/integrase [Pseudobdellovibrionaceae bacterium]
MQDFIVAIYPSSEGNFLASYLHPLSKKRIREYFKTKEEANTYKKKIEEKFRRNRVANYQELLVEDLIVLFMQDHPKSEFTRMKRYTADFAETFGLFKIQDVSRGVLKIWLDQIQKENDLKEITMRGLKCDIDSFFGYLIKKEIISESPLTSVYYRKTVPEIAARNILSKKQIEDLLESAKAYSPGYFYPIVKMFTDTAAKPNEIVDLMWNQVRFETREIYFPRTLKSQERRIKISEELIAILEKRKKATGFVFMTYYKEPFTKTKLARLINEFKIKTSCKIKWTPMDLRHSYAVNFLRTGGDIRRLQQILGHDNVFDTRRLYAEALAEREPIEIQSPFEIGS